MTPEEARKLQDEWIASRPKWGEQDEHGIDLGHLRTNLRLTPTERAEKHRRALAFALEWSRGANDTRLRALRNGSG